MQPYDFYWFGKKAIITYFSNDYAEVENTTIQNMVTMVNLMNQAHTAGKNSTIVELKLCLDNASNTIKRESDFAVAYCELDEAIEKLIKQW